MISTSNFSVDYYQLYQTAPCGYVCSLPNGKIVEVNQRFLDFTGYQKKEILHQKSLPDFLTKAGKIFYDSSFLVILKLKGHAEELSFTLLRKDKSQFPVLINSIEIKNEEGECMYVQSTVFDISQRKNYESQLLAAKKNADQLNQKLSALNMELESLAYIATHDLKSPILDIEGHFEYLKDKITPQNQYVKESIGFIDDGIRQFKSTVYGLTEAIRLKKTKVELVKIDLKEELDQLLPRLKVKVEEAGGTLEIDLQEEIPIIGSSIFVKSILQNVTDNAVKYRSISRSLKINITGRAFGDFYCLKIEDNGIGINLKKHENRLFKMFNRFNDEVEGSGMGLYITKKMIEKIEGKIQLESEEGIGSAFRLYFKRSK